MCSNAVARSRRCGVCGETKDIAEFYQRRGRPSGNYARCKPCSIAAFKARYYGRDPRVVWAEQACMSARKRATRLRLAFTIRPADLLAVAGETCPALGLVLDYRRGKRVGPCSPTVDRLRAADGYVPGNIAVISMRANQIKSDATPDEVLAVWR